MVANSNTLPVVPELDIQTISRNMILELSPMVANRYTLPVVPELEILTIGRNMILLLVATDTFYQWCLSVFLL